MLPQRGAKGASSLSLAAVCAKWMGGRLLESRSVFPFKNETVAVFFFLRTLAFFYASRLARFFCCVVVMRPTCSDKQAAGSRL